MPEQTHHEHDEDHDVLVSVGEQDFRMSADAVPYWVVAGQLITNARATLGNELAFSIMLSRNMRELRRAYGVQGAIDTLRGFLATMDEAGQFDCYEFHEKH